MRDGDAMPRLGFGTYGRWGNAGIDALLCALETGYRLLDTAQSYNTEYEVGEAVRRSGLNRDEVFITTKIDTANFDQGKLVPSLEKSLETIGVDQVDLALIHWPSPNGRLPLEIYMNQLKQAHERGLARQVGVSNFTIALIEAARPIMGEVPIANNQFELHPYLQNKKLAAYCLKNGVSVTCYLPIARGTLGTDKVLAGIARAHGATVEQVCLAFELGKGYCAIPTSGKPERIRSNFAAGQLTLTPSEMAAIEGIDRGHRLINVDWGPKWD